MGDKEVKLLPAAVAAWQRCKRRRKSEIFVLRTQFFKRENKISVQLGRPIVPTCPKYV